jgi:hypothetical protein
LIGQFNFFVAGFAATASGGYDESHETFGGAIFHAAQRTDVDNLDHLAEVGGAYRVKLTNELQETQYVDELKLLVVDHAQKRRLL